VNVVPAWLWMSIPSWSRLWRGSPGLVVLRGDAINRASEETLEPEAAEHH